MKIINFNCTQDNRFQPTQPTFLLLVDSWMIWTLNHILIKNTLYRWAKEPFYKQEHSDLNWENKVWSFKFCQLNYALYWYIFSLICNTLSRIRTDSNCQVHSTAFSKHLTLPMETYPFFTASRIRIDTNRLEDEGSTINLWPCIFMYIIYKNWNKLYVIN